MNEVTFNEQNTQRSISTKKHLSDYIIKYSFGLLNNKKQANIFLVILSLISLITSIILFTSSTKVQIPEEALINPEYGLPTED